MTPLSNFFLTRSQFLSDGIFGKLCNAAGTQVAVTLEHAYENADGTFSPKLPPGIYLCVRRFSPHFGYDVFLIQNVQGHTFMEIHVGNFNRDSDGCVLLGESLGHDELGCLMILNSRKKFVDFMETQAGINSFLLNVG